MSDINRSAAEQILSALECVSEIATGGGRISIRAHFDKATAKALRDFADGYSRGTNATAFLILLIRTRRCEMQDTWDMYDPALNGDDILDEDALKLCAEILADAALG